MNKNFEKLESYVQQIEDNSIPIDNRLKAHKNACIRLSNSKKELNGLILKIKEHKQMDTEKEIDFDEIISEAQQFIDNMDEMDLEEVADKYLDLDNKLRSGLKNLSKVKMEVNKVVESLGKIQVESLDDLFTDQDNQESEDDEESEEESEEDDDEEGSEVGSDGVFEIDDED